MKLIDLLVQELPISRGWPCKADAVVQEKQDTEFYFFYGRQPRLSSAGNEWVDAEAWIFYDGKHDLADDWNTAIVTREEYEAALAASKQPKWNGEGIPPEGSECEVKSGKNSWSLCKVVHSSSAGVAFIYLEEPSGESSSRYLGVIDSIPHKHAGSYFRPISTEAERKREEAVYGLAETIIYFYGNPKGAESYKALAERVIEAISIGKIPGLRLE